MKHFTVFSTLLMLSVGAMAATKTTKTLNVDGVDRIAVVFAPDEASLSDMPVLMFLHPNGYSAEASISAFGLDKISDNMKAVVVVPEALNEQNEEIHNLFEIASETGAELPGFSLEYVWNAGAKITLDALATVIPPEYASYLVFLSLPCPGIASAGCIQFNKDVDDVKFLNEVLNDVKGSYSVDSEKVFVMGASMGGAMTYRYILSPNTQAKGAVVFCGFLGGDVKFNGTLDMPLMVVHSKTDEIVSFEGGMLDIAVAERVEKFAKANGGNAATETPIADIADDGITVVRYDYDCPADKQVRLFVTDGAKHSDFLTAGKNDIDYIAEVSKFFFGEGSITAVSSVPLQGFAYNKAADAITISAEGKYTISTLGGVAVQSGVANGEPISVAGLQRGIYIFAIETAEGLQVAKFIR